MYSIICAIRLTAEKIVECELEKRFRSIEEARAEIVLNDLIVAYRIFDKTGYRIYSEKVEKNS